MNINVGDWLLEKRAYSFPNRFYLWKVIAKTKDERGIYCKVFLIDSGEIRDVTRTFYLSDKPLFPIYMFNDYNFARVCLDDILVRLV